MAGQRLDHKPNASVNNQPVNARKYYLTYTSLYQLVTTFCLRLASYISTREITREII